MKYLFLLILISINFESTTKNKVTPSELKKIITKSNSDFNIIYTYTDWCSPCVKEFPIFLQFCKENKVTPFIIILSKDGNADLDKFKLKFNKKYSFNSDYIFNYSFRSDIVKSLKKSNYKNYQGFIKELLGNNYNSDIIYGSDNFILTNQNSEVIYVAESGSYEKKYSEISNLIK